MPYTRTRAQRPAWHASGLPRFCRAHRESSTQLAAAPQTAEAIPSGSRWNVSCCPLRRTRLPYVTDKTTWHRSIGAY